MQDNHLLKEIQAYRHKMRKIWAGLALAGIVIFTIFHVYLWGSLYAILTVEWIILSLIWCALMLGNYFRCMIGNKKINRLRSGLAGEMRAMNIFDEMSGFDAFNQVFVKNERSRTGTTEIDIVLVGKNSVFVVEIKNNAGRIFMDEDRDHWDVTIQRGDSVHDSEMRNPIKQAKVQAKVLSHALRKQMGAKAPKVIPIVGFTSDDALLMVRPGTEPSIPVFRPPMDKIKDGISSIDASNAGGWSLDRTRVIEAIKQIMVEGMQVHNPIQH